MASWYLGGGEGGVARRGSSDGRCDLAWVSAWSKSTRDSRRASRSWTMWGWDWDRSWISSGSSSRLKSWGSVAGVADVLPGALAPHGDAGVGEVAVEFAEDVAGAAGGVAAAEGQQRDAVEALRVIQAGHVHEGGKQVDEGDEFV